MSGDYWNRLKTELLWRERNVLPRNAHRIIETDLFLNRSYLNLIDFCRARSPDVDLSCIGKQCGLGTRAGGNEMLQALGTGHCTRFGTTSCDWLAARAAPSTLMNEMSRSDILDDDPHWT